VVEVDRVPRPARSDSRALASLCLSQTDFSALCPGPCENSQGSGARQVSRTIASPSENVWPLGSCRVIADIDRFNFVNGTCCHVVGDDVIRTVARRMASELSGLGLLARVGGGNSPFCARDCRSMTRWGG
jgi:Diguanylate cyclase, GGDEF domain